MWYNAKRLLVHPHTLTDVVVSVSCSASSSGTLHPRDYAHGIKGVGVKIFFMKKVFFVVLASFLVFFFASQKVRAFSFAVIGDTQKFKAGPRSVLRKAALNIKAANVDFSVMLGDFCPSYNKCASKLKKWEEVASPLFPKIYPTHGNHDAVSASEWQATFNPPLNGPEGYVGWTYSFDHENSHFVVIDSDRSSWHLVDQTQRDWLEQDLAATTKENIFVFLHEPAFPTGKKIGSCLDANPTERDAFWQILDEFDVTAVFSGHEHIFSRQLIDSSVFSGAKNSIYQFGVGNTDSYAHPKPRRPVEYYYRQKSYLIVRVDGEKITTDLYTPKGKLLNSFSFSK